MVGARLLANNNRNVSLTRGREMFLKEAYQVLDQVRARGGKGGASGSRQRAGNDHRLYFFRALYRRGVAQPARLSSALPAGAYQMREINTKQQIEPLLNGELDLRVMRNTRLPEVLHYQLLLREPLVAVVPEGHPLAETPGGALRFQHLAQEPFVFFSREVGTTALYDENTAVARQRRALPHVHHRGSGEAVTIIELVSTGLGVSILPASFAGAGGRRRALFAAGGPDATTEVWLVHHRRRPLTAAARGADGIDAEMTLSLGK